MLRMKSMRTCALALGLVTLLSTSVRADVPGSTQQLGAQPGMTQEAPAISGSGVVWTNFDGVQFDIYYQDVASGAAPQNLTPGSPDNEFLEDIDRGFVVFTHTGGMTNSPGDVKLLDTSTGKLTNVANGSADVHFAHPAISGNYIVFERITGTSKFDIDIYDRTAGGLPSVTDDDAMQLHPRVSGDNVVYEDYARNPSGTPDVYGFSVMAQSRFLIAQNAKWPDVDGDNVVYIASDATGGDQLFLYDLVSGTSRALTSARGPKATPRISGTRVIWTDGRNGVDNDLYTCDLATGVESLLVGGAGNQATGDISGNRVVYSSTDANGGSSGVFLFTFIATPVNDIPVGCDPSKTDLVKAPTQLVQNARRPVYASGQFENAAGKTYYLCVENGLANGTRRSASVLAAVDGGVVLSPADFKPEKSPPRFVTAKLTLDPRSSRVPKSNVLHQWDVALFQADTTISISIRVAK
ncbi:MAG: domain containing protein [Myxococcales bacterium]|nr:domain containing protein [Myxococcales bacterium]